MKDKIIKLLNSKLLFAFVLNVLIMLLCIHLTSFSYDSSKDFYNSLYISQNHYYFGSSVNYILATLVGSVQYVLMNFNCFVLAQILLSCVAFTSVTFVFADKFNKKKALIFTALIVILFATHHYSDILQSLIRHFPGVNISERLPVLRRFPSFLSPAILSQYTNYR